MRTQMQAIMLGAIGAFLASPVPKNIMAALSPGRGKGADNVFATGSGKFWLIANDVFMPMIQVVGIALVAWAVIALLVKGRKAGFRQPISPIAINHGLALLLAIMTGALVAMNPPAVAWPTDEVGDTIRRAADGATTGEYKEAPTVVTEGKTSAFNTGNTTEAKPQEQTSAFAK